MHRLHAIEREIVDNFFCNNELRLSIKNKEIQGGNMNFEGNLHVCVQNLSDYGKFLEKSIYKVGGSVIMSSLSCIIGISSYVFIQK